MTSIKGDRGVGLRVLAGQGAQIDTTTSAGRLVIGIFAALGSRCERRPRHMRRDGGNGPVGNATAPWCGSTPH